MLKKFIQIIKGIAEQLAVAFFFTSIFIVVVNIFYIDKIELIVSLVNRVTIVEKNVVNQDISFDPIEKRLLTYPSYGSIWANLKIPSIDVEAPIYHGDTLDIIKYGIGHYAGSYFPGEGSSIILAAHNSKQHFMYLPNLKVDDKIIIEANYGTYTYQVTSTKIIEDTDEASLPIQNDKELLMMYTCYPVNTIGHKSKRYVVYAKLVGEEYEK